MGCWNGTDGFGGLPIKAGVKIKAVIIQNNSHNPEASGFCYLGGFATPVSFILDCNYNDYGGIEQLDENSKSAVLLRDFIESELQNGNMKVMPERYDYKDINSTESKIKTLGDMSLEDFINDYIERDRLYRRYREYQAEDTYTNVGLMMFNNNIFNSVSEALFKDTGWDNGDTIKENIENDTLWYVEDTFDTPRVSERDLELIEVLKKSLDEIDDEMEKKATLDYIEELKSGKSLFLKYWENPNVRKSGRWSNVVRMLSSYDNINNEAFAKYHDLISKHYKSEDKTLYSSILFDFVMLLKCMIALRAPWRSTSGKGGQDYNESAFIGLIDGIKKELVEDMESMLQYGSYCNEDWMNFTKEKEYKVTEVTYNSYTLIDDYDDPITISKEEYSKYFEH